MKMSEKEPVPVLAPLPVGAAGKKLLAGIRRLVSRIALQHFGNYGQAEDLLLVVYLSGVTHGAILGKRVLEAEANA
jgi:hypothetical protein